MDNHLELITKDGLLESQKEAFHVYASSSTKGKKMELGINGFGKFQVNRMKGKITVTNSFDKPEDAIKLYKDKY